MTQKMENVKKNEQLFDWPVNRNVELGLRGPMGPMGAPWGPWGSPRGFPLLFPYSPVWECPITDFRVRKGVANPELWDFMYSRRASRHATGSSELVKIWHCLEIFLKFVGFFFDLFFWFLVVVGRFGPFFHPRT